MSAREDSTVASPSDATVAQPAAGAGPTTAAGPPPTAPGASAEPNATAEPDAAAGAAGEASSGGDSRTADFVAGPGGVMTDEVGVVTGDLTLRTELTAGEITLRVQYKDADEWYVVTGGRTSLKDPADLDAVHTLAIALLNRPEG